MHVNCELREAKPGFREEGILISFGDRLPSLKLRKGVRSSRWVLGKASGERGWGSASSVSTRPAEHPEASAGGTREESHQGSHWGGCGGLRVRWAAGTVGPRAGAGAESCAAMSRPPPPARVRTSFCTHRSCPATRRRAPAGQELRQQKG